jgi:nucleoid-associated protein YgaU
MQSIERNGLIALLFLCCSGAAFWFSSGSPESGATGPRTPQEDLQAKPAPERGSKTLNNLPAVSGPVGAGQRAPAGPPRGSAGTGQPGAGPAGAGPGANPGALANAQGNNAGRANPNGGQGAPQNPAAGNPTTAGKNAPAGNQGAGLPADERLMAGANGAQFQPLSNSQQPVLAGGSGRIDPTATAPGTNLGGLHAGPPRGNANGSLGAGLEVTPGAGPGAAPAAPVFERYTVRSGDSLSEIAQKQLGSSKRVDLILQVNPGLRADRINVGQVLNMPTNQMILAAAAAAKAGSTAANPAANTPAAGNPGAATQAALADGARGNPQASNAQPEAAVAQNANSRQASAEPAGPTHTVAAGESLWAIAQRRLGDGNRYREIEALNPSVRGGRLAVGTKLRLPDGSAPLARADDNTPSQPADAPRPAAGASNKPTRRVR